MLISDNDYDFSNYLFPFRFCVPTIVLYRLSLRFLGFLNAMLKHLKTSVMKVFSKTNVFLNYPLSLHNFITPCYLS